LRKDASKREPISLSPRDTQDVTDRAQDRDMTIQLSCPWCTDEVAFTINEADEELVCSSCDTRMDFAPDPGVTFELLYAAVA
jgi:hypothetical protein